MCPDVPQGYGAKATMMGITKVNARGPAAKARLVAKVAPPSAGRWTANAAFDVAQGRFELQVAGRKKLTGSTRAGRAVWIVGKRAPGEPDGANPVAIRASQAGKTVTGTFELTFDSRRHATGELRLGGCRLFFEARR
jgi:hypothetical protein